MSNEAAQKRLDDLQNVVTELHDNLPVVMNSRMQSQIADPHLERIAEALVLITEELRDLSIEVRGPRNVTGGGYVAPRSVPRDPGDPNPATMGF